MTEEAKKITVTFVGDGEETEEWCVSGPNDDWDDYHCSTREEAMEVAEGIADETGAIVIAEMG